MKKMAVYRADITAFKSLGVERPVVRQQQLFLFILTRMVTLFGTCVVPPSVGVLVSFVSSR
jgi:hypothetical protein